MYICFYLFTFIYLFIDACQLLLKHINEKNRLQNKNHIKAFPSPAYSVYTAKCHL